MPSPTRLDALSAFGRELMLQVRDEAIEKFEKIASGKMTSDRARVMYNQISQLNPEEANLLRDIVLSSVDDVLHNLLFTIEQGEGFIEVKCKDGYSGEFKDISSESDGLSGELYTEDGWIAKFSKYKENY